VARILVPDPIADFTDSASGCEPLEVRFQSNSLYARTYLWDFGDGVTSRAENPAHVYVGEGEYNVSLTVTGFEPGLSDQEVKTEYIKVYKSPRASFSANKEQVFIPNDPVVFTNLSINADSYVWDFGDGGFSTQQSPVYNYQTQGEFQVTLIANTEFGCADTFRLPNTVFAQLEGRIQIPNAFTPNPNGPNSGRINPGSSAELNDVFYVMMNGVSKYELNIFNKWGELLFVSKTYMCIRSRPNS
jgi:PKD repeat protein